METCVFRTQGRVSESPAVNRRPSAHRSSWAWGSLATPSLAVEGGGGLEVQGEATCPTGARGLFFGAGHRVGPNLWGESPSGPLGVKVELRLALAVPGGSSQWQVQRDGKGAAVFPTRTAPQLGSPSWKRLGPGHLQGPSSSELQVS